MLCPVCKTQTLQMAERHGIELTNHSLYLYGHCNRSNCEHKKS
mgnify:CR=1 FL=1